MVYEQSDLVLFDVIQNALYQAFAGLDMTADTSYIRFDDCQSRSHLYLLSLKNVSFTNGIGDSFLVQQAGEFVSPLC